MARIRWRHDPEAYEKWRREDPEGYADAIASMQADYDEVSKGLRPGEPHPWDHTDEAYEKEMEDWREQRREEGTARAVFNALKASEPAYQPDPDFLGLNSRNHADRVKASSRLDTRSQIREMRSRALGYSSDDPRRLTCLTLADSLEKDMARQAKEEPYSYIAEADKELFRDAKDSLEQMRSLPPDMLGRMEAGRLHGLIESFNRENREDFSYFLEDTSKGPKLLKLEHSGTSGRRMSQIVEGPQTLRNLATLTFPGEDHPELEEAGQVVDPNDPWAARYEKPQAAFEAFRASGKMPPADKAPSPEPSDFDEAKFEASLKPLQQAG